LGRASRADPDFNPDPDPDPDFDPDFDRIAAVCLRCARPMRLPVFLSRD
jgi:hypothetical protein